MLSGYIYPYLFNQSSATAGAGENNNSHINNSNNNNIVINSSNNSNKNLLNSSNNINTSDNSTSNSSPVQSPLINLLFPSNKYSFQENINNTFYACGANSNSNTDEQEEIQSEKDMYDDNEFEDDNVGIYSFPPNRNIPETTTTTTTTTNSKYTDKSNQDDFINSPSTPLPDPIQQTQNSTPYRNTYRQTTKSPYSKTKRYIDGYGTLYVYSAEQKQAVEYTIDKKLFTIGSRKNNEVLIPGLIRKTFMIITHENNQLRLTNLTRNTVRVNGIYIPDSGQILNDGDHIRYTTTTLIFKSSYRNIPSPHNCNSCHTTDSNDADYPQSQKHKQQRSEKNNYNIPQNQPNSTYSQNVPNFNNHHQTPSSTYINYNHYYHTPSSIYHNNSQQPNPTYSQSMPHINNRNYPSSPSYTHHSSQQPNSTHSQPIPPYQQSPYNQNYKEFHHQTPSQPIPTYKTQSTQTPSSPNINTNLFDKLHKNNNSNITVNVNISNNNKIPYRSSKSKKSDNDDDLHIPPFEIYDITIDLNSNNNIITEDGYIQSRNKSFLRTKLFDNIYFSLSPQLLHYTSTIRSNGGDITSDVLLKRRLYRVIPDFSFFDYLKKPFYKGIGVLIKESWLNDSIHHNKILSESKYTVDVVHPNKLLFRRQQFTIYPPTSSIDDIIMLYMQKLKPYYFGKSGYEQLKSDFEHEISYYGGDVVPYEDLSVSKVKYILALRDLTPSEVASMNTYSLVSVSWFLECKEKGSIVNPLTNPNYYYNNIMLRGK
ncbi:putative histone-like transcription factor [Tieghemostelium lacteum]|uniref:Putative histone-like transcription factor n=1 Tax=Tieghemostelium lacteum TaxID=361077 RepID=A0A152A3K0_TIELA|nr:putative histone-like transcription factor [Tieghemostelium lacteum]|eukprot:KYR00842.1 putative histone-like transcription factor [Tieghemostelium lacteum]